LLKRARPGERTTLSYPPFFRRRETAGGVIPGWTGETQPDKGLSQP
jgi:hypothetical protein